MDTTNGQGSDQSITQVTVSLAEIDSLRSKVIDLQNENAELKVNVESLKKQLHDLTDPAKLADAAAFRDRRRYE